MLITEGAEGMAWYLVFWRHLSTATVVPAASASQARSRAQRKQKRVCEAIVAARRADTFNSQFVSRADWVLNQGKECGT